MSGEATLSWCSRTPEETSTMAAGLAAAWLATADSRCLVLNLNGPLGAGKTAFVKGLATGMGFAPDQVSSPTFVLANQYPSPAGLWLHHVDFYRIEAFSELESIGFYDLIEPRSVLAVEWGDRFSEALPCDRIDITLQSEGAEQRLFSVRARGRSLGPLVASWAEDWVDGAATGGR